ncbi:Uncharacterised protein [uncultured archaeon]|nr:Uncharacterised protein [uncultured archaeon]
MNTRNLMLLPKKKLDNLYSRGSFLHYPEGFYEGKPLFFLFSFKLIPLNWLASLFWKGKYFYEVGRLFCNKLLWFKLFYGRFYFGKSSFDKKSCIVLDYHKSSLIGFFARDEIRSVGDNLFLGRAYFLGIFTCYFVLNSN